TRAGREALIGWWMNAGRHDDANSILMNAEAYGDISPDIVQDAPLPITRGLHALWLARYDLQTAFDIREPAGRKGLVEWSTDQRETDAEFTRAAPVEDAKEFPEKFGSFLSGGVNVIGFGRGEFGIGEDVRMAVCALTATDLNYCVPRIPL